MKASLVVKIIRKLSWWPQKYEERRQAESECAISIHEQVKEIQECITDTIEPESTILSDQYKGYVTIDEKGYTHEAQKKPDSWEHASGDDDRVLPHVHRTISLLKRWYYGTYHGRIDPKNLQSYLDEFVFRFHRRTSKSRGLIFTASLKRPSSHLTSLANDLSQVHMQEISLYRINLIQESGRSVRRSSCLHFGRVPLGDGRRLDPERGQDGCLSLIGPGDLQKLLSCYLMALKAQSR